MATEQFEVTLVHDHVAAETWTYASRDLAMARVTAEISRRETYDVTESAGYVNSASAVNRDAWMIKFRVARRRI